jgi:diguanylate cyclase (GGDEF)-like protein
VNRTVVGAVKRWWGQPDHYYWLTAFLTARGVQATFCRSISVTLAVVSVLIVVTIGSPAGPRGTLSQGVAVAVAAAGAVMAAGWWRRRLPSPTVSAWFVVAAAVSIGALSVMQTDPLAGLLASTGFAVLGGYAGFFHTPRIVAFNVAIAAVVTLVLAWRLAVGGDPLMAVPALGFVMIVNLATPTACQGLVQLLGIDVLNVDIDPTTGLLNRQAFYRSATTYIASRARAEDRFLVLVVVSIDSLQQLADAKGRWAADRVRVEVGQAVRENTRHDTITGSLGGGDFVVADCFAGPNPTPLVERIRGAVTTTPSRSTASIGVISTPMAGLAQYPPDDLLDELIGVADAAMRQARDAGGNQVRQTVYPEISLEPGER